MHQDHGAHEEAGALVVPGAREDALHRRPHIRQFHARAAELIVATKHRWLRGALLRTGVLESIRDGVVWQWKGQSQNLIARVSQRAGFAVT